MTVIRSSPLIRLDSGIDFPFGFSLPGTGAEAIEQRSENNFLGAERWAWKNTPHSEASQTPHDLYVFPRLHPVSRPMFN